MTTPPHRRVVRPLVSGVLMLLVALVALLPMQSAALFASPSPQAKTPQDDQPFHLFLPVIQRFYTEFSHLSDPGDTALVRHSLQSPIQDDVFYFLLPDRFNNGDPSNDVGADPGGTTDADVLRHGFLLSNKGYYHGGDIKGVLDKLDYIQDMGVTAIWMAPIFKNRPVQCGDTQSIATCSAGYHGYWITDFTDVDPHFGTKADLQALVTAAHARGMKVFFDIIVNHTADVIDYAEHQYDYRSKAAFPYKDASGHPFDDKAYAGGTTFPPLDPAVSFPYTPVFRTPADATIKKPDWLNDRTVYHNRGNSTFAGESAEYGDFVGLDDLFTEQPRVVQGMTDIYNSWITDYGIDGYRIDTVKHVNMEFWQRFSPAVLSHAADVGKPNFFMFGEVYSGNPRFTSEYTTQGRLPAVLDFPFQGAARSFASGGATNGLRDLFAQDDFYTDADSNAYELPTFLGNHDMGRIGTFLKQDNPSADDAELLARDKLAHALMYFSRGVPIVYYGDEQGFVGDGGDQDAREDMFPSQVASYNDNDLIGTNSTTAQANFNESHPLYQALKTYAAIRRANEALRRGAQIQRYSTDHAGIYAFSRVAEVDHLQYEYVLAFNNAKTEQTATFATYQPNATFLPVYAATSQTLQSTASGDITVTVPPLSFVIYMASRTLPNPVEAPGIRLTSPTLNQQVNGRVEVAAELNMDRPTEVTFAVKVGDAPTYTIIGTDDNAPYRVFYDTSGLPAGTRLTFKAIANDVSDDTATSVFDVNSATTVAVAAPRRHGQVVFNVTVPANTPPDKSVFIAGELPNLDPNLPAWDPGAVTLTRSDATHWTITISGDEGTTMEYKYTLGSWDFVEKSSSCAEIANRQLTVTFDASGTQVVNDTIANWRNVAPCGS